MGLAVLLISFTPLVPWWAHQLSGPLADPHGDVLIVLAAADSGEGILSYSSYLRSEYALRAWREGWVKTIVISGGSEQGEAPARTMIRFLESQGVPAAVLQGEYSSTSTRENALATRDILQRLPGTKVLLTSDYHMLRARRAFEKAGLQVLPRPFPDVIKRSSSLWGRWQAFASMCAETAKLGYYRGRGWI